MVKHTQTIRRQIADELFEFAWPFCEIGAKRVKIYSQTITLKTKSARTVQPCMEYCFHGWASSPNCFLDMMGKLSE